VPEAIAHHEAGVRLRPEFAPGHFNLGVLYANTGRIPEALRQFEIVRQLDPASDNARRAIELLTTAPKP